MKIKKKRKEKNGKEKEKKRKEKEISYYIINEKRTKSQIDE